MEINPKMQAEIDAIKPQLKALKELGLNPRQLGVMLASLAIDSNKAAEETIEDMEKNGKDPMGVVTAEAMLEVSAALTKAAEVIFNTDKRVHDAYKNILGEKIQEVLGTKAKVVVVDEDDPRLKGLGIDLKEIAKEEVEAAPSGAVIH